MNKDTQRLILASILIFLVVVLTKPVFQALGYNLDPQTEEVQIKSKNNSSYNNLIF